MFWNNAKSGKPAPIRQSTPGKQAGRTDSGTSARPDPEGPRASDAPRRSQRPSSPDEELELALDAFATVLRAMGRYALELPEADARATAETCERWASHILIRTPAPCGARPDDDSDPGPAPREWRLSSNYVTTLRKNEHVLVNKALSDLRQVIWAFVHGLNQALVAEEKTDGVLKAQLGRLSNAAQSASTEDLKREALSVADSIGTLFETRRKAQMEQAAEFGARMAALGEALEEARREVALDPLTRLFNRKTFDEELSRVVDMRGILRRPACLVLVDVDHFKRVNDRYGHPVGDEVLRQLTGAIARTFRHRDDVVARYGGEEFAIILRETDLKDAVMLCERLLGAVRSMKVVAGDQTLSITVSAGVTQHAFGELDADWLARTDATLYEAKRAGRDRCVAA